MSPTYYENKVLHVMTLQYLLHITCLVLHLHQGLRSYRNVSPPTPLITRCKVQFDYYQTICLIACWYLTSNVCAYATSQNLALFLCPRVLLERECIQFTRDDLLTAMYSDKGYLPLRWVSHIRISAINAHCATPQTYISQSYYVPFQSRSYRQAATAIVALSLLDSRV